MEVTHRLKPCCPVGVENLGDLRNENYTLTDTHTLCEREPGLLGRGPSLVQSPAKGYGRMNRQTSMCVTVSSGIIGTTEGVRFTVQVCTCRKCASSRLCSLQSRVQGAGPVNLWLVRQ